MFVHLVMGEDSLSEETIRAVVISWNGVEGLTSERETVGEDVVRVIWMWALAGMVLADI